MFNRSYVRLFVRSFVRICLFVCISLFFQKMSPYVFYCFCTLLEARAPPPYSAPAPRRYATDGASYYFSHLFALLAALLSHQTGEPGVHILCTTYQTGEWRPHTLHYIIIRQVNGVRIAPHTLHNRASDDAAHGQPRGTAGRTTHGYPGVRN